MPTNGTELLTLDEAAIYLRVHRRTMGRLLREGRVPGTKIGRQWRIRRTDLDALMATTSRGSSPNGTPNGTEESGSSRAQHEARTARALPLTCASLASLIGAGLGLLA
jgi:excisionase family DNA binding protein